MMVRGAKDSRPKFSLNLIDTESGMIVAESDSMLLHQNTYDIINGDILVVGSPRNNTESGTFFYLDGKTLKIKEEGPSEIFPYTSIAISKGAILAITRDAGKWKLGKFAIDLSLASVFEDALEPNTSILVAGDSVYVQADTGRILRYQLE